MASVPRKARNATKAAPTYGVTFLVAEDGKRLAKLYRDPNAPPDDFDAGILFTPVERKFSTFDAFVDALAECPSDACIIRGALCAEARDDQYVKAGGLVRRLATDRDGCRAAFEACARSWIVLDADKTMAPFDPADPEGSIRAWRATLPDEIRNAESAFFSSAKAHLSPTVRGKLVVALAAPLDNKSAARYANANGFDGSVCHTVQPNYFAAPIFEQGDDPLAECRSPTRFEGAPATLPAVSAPKAHAAVSLESLPPADKGIAAALGDWREHRTKFQMCGAVAGLMRRADYTPHQCAAVIREWLPAGDPDVDVEWGLGWGLKAWEKDPHEVSGAEKVAELVGPERARQVALAVEAGSWVGRSSVRQGHPAVSQRAEAYINELLEPAPPANDDVPARDATNPLATLGHDPGFDAACAPLDWLIEGLQIAPGKVSLLTAYAGGSKTPTAGLVAVCVAAGVPCLGHEVRRGPVLYLAAEGGRNARRKILRIARGLGRDARKLEADRMLKVLDAGALNPARVAALRAAIARFDFRLVVIDTLTSALRSGNATRNDEAYARVLFDLGEISEETRCTFLGLSHDNKSADGPDLRGVTGTSGIVEAAQTVIRLEPDPSNPTLIKVSCGRAVDSPFAAFGVRWEDGEGSVGATIQDGVELPLRCVLDDAAVQDKRGVNPANHGRAAARLDDMRRVVPRVLDAIKVGAGGGCTFKEIQNAVEAEDISGKALRVVIARLVEGGAVDRPPHGGIHQLTKAWKAWPATHLQGRALQLVEVRPT